MKLATLADGSRDGHLLVVDPSGTWALSASHVAPHLQAALDDWARAEPELRAVYRQLRKDPQQGSPLPVDRLAAPLPRAYEWIDGCAYPSHRARLRPKSPAPARSEPRVCQGPSGALLGPRAPLSPPSPPWGLDFAGQVCAILGDTPHGVTEGQAAPHIRLLTLANSVSYRPRSADAPPEARDAFGAVHATALAPLAVTPDALDGDFAKGRLQLRLVCALNGQRLGEPDAGEMRFSFFELIEHICKARKLTAGTIVGSGTVSSADEAQGVACLAELRALETVAYGAPRTPFLAPRDHIRIDVQNAQGQSVFGAIEQVVLAP